MCLMQISENGPECRALMVCAGYVPKMFNLWFSGVRICAGSAGGCNVPVIRLLC